MLLTNLILVLLLLFEGVLQDRAPENPNTSEGSTAFGVDQHGNPVKDPTKNVLDLVNASARRADDLRLADLRYLELVIKRIDDLRLAEAARVNEQLAIRASYEERLTKAEADRINAIRAVDVNAVAVASQRQSDQAAVLATQVTQTAETLRALVATTANTSNLATSAANAALSDRITALEQKQYVGQGRQAYTDPQMVEMAAKMETLLRAQNASTGRSEGYGNLWVWFVAGAGILIGVLPYLRGTVRPRLTEQAGVPNKK